MRLGSERSPLAESPNPGSPELAPSLPPAEVGPLDPPSLALESPPLLDVPAPDEAPPAEGADAPPELEDPPPELEDPPPELEDPLEPLLGDDDPPPEFDDPLEPPLDDDDPLVLPLDPELLDGGMEAEGEDGDDGVLAEGQPESSGSSRQRASSSLWIARFMSMSPNGLNRAWPSV